MVVSHFLSRLVRGLIPLCIFITVYLYLYPAFHGCSFPAPHHTDKTANSTKSPGILGHADLAPFRLLALGDPQLEGDTSLPNPNDPLFPGLYKAWSDLSAGDRGLLHPLWSGFSALIREDIPRQLNGLRKRIDLFGNDFYLAHIYRTLHWWTRPTHVAVLGDLLGSQWINDGEFERRAWRFWNRVFKHGEKVQDNITSVMQFEDLGKDPAWSRRIINIAGNHDIGYAGDIKEERVARFEREFGRVNWEIAFQLPRPIRTLHLAVPPLPPPELRIVVLNTMNLDSPAVAHELQSDTYSFMNKVISRSLPVEDRTHATILLTHIPLHKEAGVCVDAPLFDYFPSHQGGGIKEQNHLSDFSSKNILEGMFGLHGSPEAPARGMGRNGIIVNGHDHEGCDILHYVERESWEWRGTRWNEASEIFSREDQPKLREITLRSMMGEFGGYAGLLSAWFDEGSGELGEWRFEFQYCRLGTQYVWWAVHILDLITGALVAAFYIVRSWERRSRRAGVLKKEITTKKPTVKSD